MTWALPPGEAVLETLKFAVVAAYLFVLPGYALLGAFGWNGSRDPLERIGLAASVSVALYPLLLLWSHTLGGPSLDGLVATPAVLVAFRCVQRLRAGPPVPSAPTRDGRGFPGLAAAAVVGLLLFSRWEAIRGMLAPAWGDSLQHSMIVQLLLEHGSLFASWRPYAPLETLSYHFGFHGCAALWAIATGQEAPLAVLEAGQALNVLAVLALFPLAKRLCGDDPRAGLAAVVFAGFFYADPGRYLNWGRYTQLCGQVILPAILYQLAGVWRSIPLRKVEHFLLGLLFAGLFLTHYRVSLLACAAVLAWTIAGLVRPRARKGARIAGTVGALVWACLLTFPWWPTLVSSGIFASLDEAVRSAAPPAGGWRNLPSAVAAATSQTPRWLVVVAALGFIAALWTRTATLLPLVLWMAIVVASANPQLVGLRGTELLTNFAVAISAYIPLSILAAWGATAVLPSLGRTRRSARLATAGLTIALFAGVAWQSRLADPSHGMITPEDLATFAWIEENVPPDAHVLINAYSPRNDFAVVGSDAGWWLPVYTRRSVTVPPLVYLIEKMTPGWSRRGIARFERKLRRTKGRDSSLRLLLCGSDVTHVYLGQDHGSVGLGAEPLLAESWFATNPAFELVHQVGRAQVWEFDPAYCASTDLAPWVKRCLEEARNADAKFTPVLLDCLQEGQVCELGRAQIRLR